MGLFRYTGSMVDGDPQLCPPPIEPWPVWMNELSSGMLMSSPPILPADRADLGDGDKFI